MKKWVLFTAVLLVLATLTTGNGVVEQAWSDTLPPTPTVDFEV